MDSMRANDVIRTNEDCGYWDVPGTDQMVHSYRTFSGSWIIEVIEPSAVMGPHGTITFLEHYWTKKALCYGSLHTARYADVTLEELKQQCYRIIGECFGWDCLLDLGTVRLDMGRIELTPDN